MARQVEVLGGVLTGGDGIWLAASKCSRTPSSPDLKSKLPRHLHPGLNLHSHKVDQQSPVLPQDSTWGMYLGEGSGQTAPLLPTAELDVQAASPCVPMNSLLLHEQSWSSSPGETGA